MAGTKGPFPAILVFGGVLGAALAARALGFAEGPLLAATPASAIALAAGVVLRARGALVAAAGFAAAGLVAGLGPLVAGVDAAAHGAAALAGSVAMRTLARRRRERTRTGEWLIALVGVAVFVLTVAGIVLAARGMLPEGSAALADPLHLLIFGSFGLLTFGAVIATLREWPDLRARIAPALAIATVGCVLVALLGYLLHVPMAAVAPSGLTLLLAMPFCLLVAMQRRSLDGAALAFVAAHVVLAILIARLGSVTAPDVLVAVTYLSFLIATSQLVHAVNLDRLRALEEVAAQKQELEERVAERTARLAAASEAALAADAAKTRFVAMVSHEVRTPLSGVLGMASILLAGRLDAAARRNVEVIRTSGLHLLDVINRILDFSRLDRPLRRSDFVELDLAALVAEVLDEARALPCAAGLALRAEIDPRVVPMRYGYRYGLRQILTNLVGNAVRFTERGSVTVRLLPCPGDTLRVEVKDTGIGIPRSLQDRIFLPFEQADGPERHGGTGLGLAICAELVRRLGGRIGVDSTPGAGACFWFELYLPVAAVAAAPRRARARA